MAPLPLPPPPIGKPTHGAFRTVPSCAGASGFCIEKKVADTLDMVTFGDYQLSGMLERFSSHMRRSRDIRLGPLTIQRPVYMEMDVHGLVKDPPGSVIGIVGYPPHPPTHSLLFLVLTLNPPPLNSSLCLGSYGCPVSSKFSRRLSLTRSKARKYAAPWTFV